MLPFFHWRPDELALAYTRFSPREKTRDRFRVHDEESAVRLARSGRGVSYHELQLALDDFAELQVLGSLASYLRRRNAVLFLSWLLRERRFEAALRRAAPDVATPFFHPYLDVVIRKPTARHDETSH
jgi:S-adenosylmethionine-dependent methyltransferase